MTDPTPPTREELAAVLRGLVDAHDYRDLDKGRGVNTPAGARWLIARNLVRRLPKTEDQQ